MESLKSDHLMVVAIDFGTTYSGYAFSLGAEFESEPTKISSNKPWIASQGLVSHKTPTCVLLKPDKSFFKFGYEAEDRYNDIADLRTGEHKQYYFFRRFKMILHSRPHLRRETTIEDETGKTLEAMKVFEHGIRYLKDHALSTINTQGKLVDEMDIHWVLTVPAIWSEGAKQFMREAALKAGIETNNLSIALEPEAASVYCKYLPSHQLSKEQMSRSMFKPDSKYMVVDLGGGTADITVHKVESDDSLCEIHGPSGGAWGGTKVDEAFVKFLAEIFGDEVMKSFLNDHMEDAIDMYREFEIRKRKVMLDMSETPNMAIKIPVALYELYEDKHGRKLKEDIKKHDKYKDRVTCLADKMKIDSNIMKSFFKKPLDDLVEHMRDILGEMPVRGTNTFIIVGGFAESGIVQETIKAKFSNMRVIIPFDAGLAVLKGAVIFGHAPMVVTSRVCRRTYGMAVSKVYVEGKYPEGRKEIANGREIVRNVFHKYMEIGQPTKVGEAVSTVPLSASRGQSLARVRVFSSKDSCPEFVTDRGCSYLGEIIVNIPEMEQEEGGTVDVKMTFGGTELTVEALEKKSRKSYRSRFDFLCGD
ncbi:heat shock 70 kDa protein 12B-like [Mercenaria mercenaria]|uniref:heat shock 70 kDa protein 12B-like n=1 Tax=Mercenaria mercenaria TaxID=6596 RepID=UPI00234EADC5|nr:heat shock 70 kDa protein 12B-like [Mercenaria mercenaria]